MILFQNQTQQQILYLYKNRDIPNAGALHDAIFSILTDATYGFVDPNNSISGAYLNHNLLDLIGNMGNRNMSLNDRIDLFVKRKFLLVNE